MKYYPTVGIECHVQLKTKTKLFAAVGNDARGAKPNTLISHICMGMPGALPALNKKAVELSCRAAFAFGARPQKFSKFDRKHYFYPDLPKGYQITQFSDPIIIGGHVDIEVDGKSKRIGITRAHLEEDAGKSTHPNGKNYSLVDLNRAGTPLLEIVSEPEINSPKEARAYARELFLLMKYAGVSDVDLYHGNMRFDVNVSVSKDPDKFGTRTETKNLNSFRSVEKAVEYEIKRQTELLERGDTIIQETRGWDESKQKTTKQRGKEEAHDYRYFPDPDIPPLVLSDEDVVKVKKYMPKLPMYWRDKLANIKLKKDQIEILLDSEAEFSPEISFLSIIDEFIEDGKAANFVANWCINIFAPLARDGEVNLVSKEHSKLIGSIYSLLSQNKLSSTKAKLLFEELSKQNNLLIDVEDYAKEKGYIQVSDEAELDKIVLKILNDNPKASNDVKNGEMKAIGFLVGQIMKETKGQANPKIVQDLIKKNLEI